MATPRPAYYESAGESDDDGHAGRSKPRSQSNVAVKRSSQSSDLGRNNAAARPPDLASDSGYSSRTAATKSSADSAKSSSDRRGSPVKTEAPPAVPDAPTPTKTRSKQSESSKKKAVQARESSKSSKTTKPSKSSKNTKPVVVRQSSTRDRTTSMSRSRRDSVGAECRDPNCDKCLGRPRVRPSPLNTAMDINYPPFTPQSPRLPSSPSRVPYGDYPPIQTQIAGSRRPSIYSQGRPTSYHGGSSLTDRYTPYAQFGSTYGSGPPPTMYNHQYAAIVGSTPAGYYNRVPPSPISGSYDGRPPMPRGISDGFAARPAAQNDPRNLPNPRYAPPGLVAAQYRQHEEESSEEEDAEGYYRYEPAPDRRIMAPPSLPLERRRPSLRSHTTSNIQQIRPTSVGYNDRNDYDYEEDQAAMARSLQLPPPPARRQSVGGSSDRRGYYATSSRGDPVLVQPARSDRPRDPERERVRRNTMYNMNVVPTLRLDEKTLNREAKADDRKRGKLDNKVDKVEAYLNSMGTGYGAVVDSLRTNATRGRASSNAARTRTNSNSQNSRDDISRVSDGSRGTTTTRKTVKGGDVTIRLDGDDVTFEGNMDGKMVKFTNGDEGNRQIIIADARGRENKYLTEGSRVTTNTSSSKSRSDRDGGRPRGNSRSGYDRDPERERREQREQRAAKQRRRVSYVDDPYRSWER